MEKHEEKKEIKINLWTFYVLVAALVILAATIISGWFLVAKQNQVQEELDNRVSTVSIIR